MQTPRKKRVIDSELLDNYIQKSGIKTAFICQNMGISRQAYYQKKTGKSSFRESEIYVLRDLAKIPAEDLGKIFYPQS